MISVILYTRAGCKLCDEVQADLTALQVVIPHSLTLIEIDSDSNLRDRFALDIPVVEIGQYQLKAPFTHQSLKTFLEAAMDRDQRAEKSNNKQYQVEASSGQHISGSDRFTLWISKHYLAVFNLFLLMYFGIPFLAPVFKKVGWNGPAAVVYKIYSPLCHQWAFRSFFLFGEQAYYPHAAAKIPGVLTFEQVSGITDANDPSRIQARQFEGDPLLGYKVAFCERDVAIWGAMALFGLVFAATGRRLPQIHWATWIIVGMIPIGLDGFSQLISQLPFTFIQTILPYRESTPFLRVLTGALFGLTTAWFLFPIVEETMAETRSFISKRFAHLKSS